MPIVSEPLGRVLGNRYRLVAALGSGASAHVFLAEDMVLQRRVAVKVLQPALARDEAFLRRFRAEARSVAALNHPHVLRVFDWGEGEDGPYLVLEYLEGGSLFDMLARGQRLSPGQAARVGAQASDGLAYAHARGIVHRDVKPANVLFDEDGRVRMADFGVARALSLSSSTDPGTMLGTARYASPEQAQGMPLDGRSDVYSLGLVLYEAVTGAVPFTRETAHATLQARIGERVPGNPALGLLAPVLGAACAPEEADRPDAAQLAERLEALAEDLAGGPLPLVRRVPVEDATLGVPIVGDLTVGVETTVSAPAGRAEVGLPGSGAAGGTAGRRAAVVNGAGFAGGDEPTATIPLVPRAPAPVGAERERHRSRRWPWLVAVLFLVACILAGAGVYVARSNLFTASRRVPKVVGDAVTGARTKLRADHFVVKIDAAVASTKVAAGKVLQQIPDEGVSLKEGSTVQIVPSAGEPIVTVPALDDDIDCAFATRLLQAVHLKAHCPALLSYTKTVPQGDVINWSYDKKLDATHALYGSTITIAVSKGPPPVPVPSFAGETYTQAAATLGADGLVAKEVTAYSTTVASGLVVSTTPGVGVAVPVGGTVTVTVSKGPQTAAVPTVVGDTVSRATSVITAAGFSVGAVYGPATGVVFTTDPLAGQTEKIGTAIILYTESPPTTGLGPGTSTTTGTGTAGAGAGATGTTGGGATGTTGGGATGTTGGGAGSSGAG